MITPDSPNGMDPRNREPDDEPVLRIGTGSGVGSGADEELNADELALRRLLRDAVQDIEPRQDALTHLRRAVPARRAHRRQLVVGTAAACLLAVVAVPAVLHVAKTVNSEVANPANASSAHDSGTNSDKADSGGGTGTSKAPSGGSTGGSASGSGKSSAKPSTRPGRTAASSADPSSATLAANAPLCTSADLGNPIGYTGAADATGQVSGYFRISNTSAGPCTISDDSPTVTAVAQGSAEASRISVVDHTAGDGSGLPDTVSNTLIMAAGSSYEVRFTWVPASGGGTTGCLATSSPSPSPTTSEDTTSGTTTEGTTTAFTDSSTTDPASVLLTHTPDAGGPAASTTIGDACAGTIYKTGAIAAT